MSQHTSGPWSIGSIDVGRGVIRPAIYGPNNVMIAECFGNNADLIAAAPDLLAALCALLSDVEGGIDFGMPFEDPDNNFHLSVMAARAAIKCVED